MVLQDRQTSEIAACFVLGLSRHYTADDVQGAYKRLALVFHPDKNFGTRREEAKRKFQAIVRAKECLLGVLSKHGHGRAAYISNEVCAPCTHAPIWTCGACEMFGLGSSPGTCKAKPMPCGRPTFRTRCFCGHTLSTHEWNGKALVCQHRNCQCPQYNYVPEGAMCVCGHHSLEHDAVPFHACNFPGCSCQTFYYEALCTCGHAWTCHSTVIVGLEKKTESNATSRRRSWSAENVNSDQEYRTPSHSSRSSSQSPRAYHTRRRSASNVSQPMRTHYSRQDTDHENNQDEESWLHSAIDKENIAPKVASSTGEEHEFAGKTLETDVDHTHIPSMYDRGFIWARSQNTACRAGSRTLSSSTSEVADTATTECFSTVQKSCHIPPSRTLARTRSSSRSEFSEGGAPAIPCDVVSTRSRPQSAASNSDALVGALPSTTQGLRDSAIAQPVRTAARPSSAAAASRRPPRLVRKDVESDPPQSHLAASNVPRRGKERQRPSTATGLGVRAELLTETARDAESEVRNENANLSLQTRPRTELAKVQQVPKPRGYRGVATAVSDGRAWWEHLHVSKRGTGLVRGRRIGINPLDARCQSPSPPILISEHAT